jgi:CheY-like chemotaxis protein
MLRPCFLVIDQEQPGNISTRKLVIETAKLNVITAYSGAEAIEALTKFPNVSGAVIDTTIHDVGCTELVQELRLINPNVPIVAIGRHECSGADHHLDSFSPQRLLDLLQSLEPEKSAEVRKHEQTLIIAEESGQAEQC